MNRTLQLFVFGVIACAQVAVILVLCRGIGATVPALTARALPQHAVSARTGSGAAASFAAPQAAQAQ
jgi:hypothetical protein